MSKIIRAKSSATKINRLISGEKRLLTKYDVKQITQISESERGISIIKEKLQEVNYLVI